MEFHLAQVNVARTKAPLDDPLMRDFVARLSEINALAEASPGFIWRSKEDGGDVRLLFNLSVWESVEALYEFVYRSAHKELLAARNNWFERSGSASQALWWIPAGHIPTAPEAFARLEYLRENGGTSHAFGFKSRFQPPQPASVAEAGAGS